MTSDEPRNETEAPLPSAAEAWTIFWSDQGRASRCMVRSPDICERLDEHWHDFASRLRGDLKLIDLGCGTGSVGRALRSAQPRLQVIGIDIARVPPSMDAGLEVISDTAMEALPFGDSSFGAAVSQFGFEYGNGETAAGELARVLVPDAPLSLLVHHADSPVVADMRRHREALQAVCGRSVRTAFVSANKTALAEQFADLRRDGLNDPIVAEVARGLQNHIAHDEPHRNQVWTAVTEALAPELAMLDSLDLLHGEAKDVGARMKLLAGSFELKPPAVLHDGRGEPIAWIVEGKRLH